MESGINTKLQKKLRSFFVNGILANLNDSAAKIESYKAFWLQSYAEDSINGENPNIFSLRFPFSEAQGIYIELVDDITMEEEFISFDMSSIEDGNLVYFLVNFNDIHGQNAEPHQPQYYFNFVANNDLKQEGYLNNPNDCNQYLAAIIDALGIEILIEE